MLANPSFNEKAYPKMKNTTATKHEIKSIKMHYATKADMIKWTVSVGVATIISIVGIVSALLLYMHAQIVSLDSRMTHMDNRLTQEIRDVRKETREEFQTLRQEMKEAFTILSDKIDDLSD